MSIYIIQGGHKLKGSISVNSSKNTGVGLLCATLLNKGVTELFNFPDLEETKRMIEANVNPKFVLANLIFGIL